MDEASKTNSIRDLAFRERYLKGRIIDIGCGRDLVCSGAEPFDLPDGDAQEIASIRDNNAYDTVHSSHCLEHMRDPVHALSQWWALVKPGGHLIVVVPDEDLYEQGFWPSRFNHDHKATFRLNSPTSWSPVSHDIKAIVQSLPGAYIVELERQDLKYDYSLQAKGMTPNPLVPLIFLKSFKKIMRAVVKPFPLARQRLTWRIENAYFRTHGIPIDQTSRDALAQIQIVAAKRTTKN